jgi:hypothetical protein
MPYFSPEATTEGSGLPIFRPVVYLPDGYIDASSELLVGELKLVIGNRPNVRIDLSINTPVSVYRGSISPTTRVAYKTLQELGVLASIHPGEQVTVSITDGISLTADNYYVRLGDASSPTTIPGTITTWRWGQNTATSPILTGKGPVGISGAADREACDNWADNYMLIAKYQLFDDLQTVQAYNFVEIDIFGNDLLPNIPANNFFDTYVHGSSIITMPPKSGELIFAGTGTDSRIIYHHTGDVVLTSSIDSFQYEITFYDETISASRTERAMVYIYVMESTTGNAFCYNTVPTITLADKPAGVLFEWYVVRVGGTQLHAPNLSHTMPSVMLADSVYWPKPLVTGYDFPRGKLTIKSLGSSGADVVRWTGAVSVDWQNPANWEHIVDGKSYAAVWTPGSACVDVIIGENCPYYPELTTPVTIRNIHLENRAMLAGIDRLTYTSASMDFEPVSSEKSRFVMWSAPLKDMYTGDYHFPNAANQPDWGLVYMNFFQSFNPDFLGSVARASTYTANFGHVGTPLPLGRAFNINILPDTKEKRFYFPHASATSYTDSKGTTINGLSRTNAGRFITDGAILPNGDVSIPVSDEFDLIQIVNPFSAYLKVGEFLSYTANFPLIEQAYKTWNGDMNAGFVTVEILPGDTMRYFIDNASVAVGDQLLIAPFQSFFVMKKGPSFSALTLNVSMTTTGSDLRRFVLRSAPAEQNIMRVTASQYSYSNTTLLRREDGTTPSYNPSEDSRKAFLDGEPVSVYTLGAEDEALAINQSNSFGVVKLGLRLKRTDAPVTLEFAGIEDFGQPAYLIDHEENDKTVDLQASNVYTFTAQTNTTGGYVTELNNRFSLRFGNLSDMEAVETDDFRVYSNRTTIHIESTGKSEITGVEIYTVTGATVYRQYGSLPSVAVAVAPNQAYFVKTYIDGKARPVRKIIVMQ